MQMKTTTSCWLFIVLMLMGTWTLTAATSKKKNLQQVNVQGENFERGYKQNAISDLVLIYQGGIQRLPWTTEQFLPYVTHTNRFGHKDWLFDGFLFLEFEDGQGHGYAQGYKGTRSALKGEWEWLAQRHFEEGKAIPALNTCIEEASKELGTPQFKHKVVIGVPEPFLDQKDWGELNGKQLDFSKNEDRIAAVKWYIDLITNLFKKNNLSNLELAGFYWVAEHMGRSNGITTSIGDYIRSKGKQFYWIPYYSSNGFSEWKKYGFDIAYLQPNYFFNKEIPNDRVDNSCALAHTHNMGLEMEFDGNALAASKNQKSDRLQNYIGSFYRNGVFRNSAIAYYEGGGAMLRFSQSQNPDDKILMDTLAYFIQERRKNEIGKILYKENFTQSESLNNKIWNIEGNPKNVAIKKEGLTLFSNKNTISITTKNKLDFTYGHVEIKAKITSSDPQATVRIRLMPTEEKLGTWPASGDLFLAKYSGNNPHAIHNGANTGKMNETLSNIKESVTYIESLQSEMHTYTCEWEEKKIIFYIDGLKTNIQEDLFNKIYSDYPHYWPFNETFYLEISVDSPSGKSAVCIESIQISK